MLEMKNEFKVKVGEKEVVLKTLNINSDISGESNEHYAAAFTRALDKKMPLKIEIEKVLTDKGLLDLESNTEKVKSISKQIKDSEIELRKAVRNERRMTKAEGREIALKMKRLRSELSSVGNELNNLFNNTVESYADNERWEYFIYATTVYADSGERYWKSFAAYRNDTDSPVYAEARKRFLSHLTGINNDELEKSYYENKWMVKMGFMNDKGQLIDEKGRLVDEDYRLISPEGYYVNESGERIDLFGNRIDKDGNLMEQDAWEVSTSPVSNKVLEDKQG